MVLAEAPTLSLLPGTTSKSSFDLSAGLAAPFARGWFTAHIDLGQDATVHSLQIRPSTSFPNGFNFLTGQFRILDSAGAELFDSGTVAFTNGSINLPMSPPVGGARSVEFNGITFESIEPGFGEFGVIGTLP